MDEVFDYLISDELATSSVSWNYARRAIPRDMGYAYHEYQTESQRREILDDCYNANFIFENIESSMIENLIKHVEGYGNARSEERFIRICQYLTSRGRLLIENEGNIEARKQGPHRSYRQVFQTFEDGVWFVKKYGKEFDYTYYGSLIGDYPIESMIQITSEIEPLLIFHIERIPSGHPMFKQKNKDFEKCQGFIGNSKEIKSKKYSPVRFYYDGSAIRDLCIFSHEVGIDNCLMKLGSEGNIFCQNCKMNYFSDTVNINEQKYSSHAHLIEYRFSEKDTKYPFNLENIVNFNIKEYIQEFTADYIQDFINKKPKKLKEVDYGSIRNRGAISEDDLLIIKKAYLSDHIAPMRADIEEEAGIPGDAIMRYKLDFNQDLARNLITDKSKWFDFVKREILRLDFVKVDFNNWIKWSEEERIIFLKTKDGITHKNIRNQIQDDLKKIIYLSNDQDFKDVVRRTLRVLVNKSVLVRAGKSSGTRHAKLINATHNSN